MIFEGCSAGTVITMPLTGLLTKYGFDGGWPSVFYSFGKCAHRKIIDVRLQYISNAILLIY